MTTEEHNQRIGKMIGYLQGQFSRDVTLIGVMSLSAAIINRVQNKGLNSKMTKFRPYSTKTTLVGQKSFLNSGTFAKSVLPLARKKSQELEGLSPIQKQQLAFGVSRRTFMSWSGEPYTWVTTIEGHRLVVLLGGYKKIRELDGLQTAHKSFTRRGFMWANFGVKKQERAKFILGGKTAQSQKLINVNSWREKQSIIDPTKQEIDILTKYISDNIIKKMREFGIAS